jgi:hypothetical protein
MKPEEYVETEKTQLENLEIKYEKLLARWFKMTSDKKEIEFLEKYIKEKRKLVKEIENEI